MTKRTKILSIMAIALATLGVMLVMPIISHGAQTALRVAIASNAPNPIAIFEDHTSSLSAEPMPANSVSFNGQTEATYFYVDSRNSMGHVELTFTDAKNQYRCKFSANLNQANVTFTVEREGTAAFVCDVRKIAENSFQIFLLPTS